MTEREIEERAALAGAVVFRMVIAALWAVTSFILSGAVLIFLAWVVFILFTS